VPDGAIRACCGETRRTALRPGARQSRGSIVIFTPRHRFNRLAITAPESAQVGREICPTEKEVVPQSNRRGRPHLRQARRRQPIPWQEGCGSLETDGLIDTFVAGRSPKKGACLTQAAPCAPKRWARSGIGFNRLAITAPESARKSLGRFAPQKKGRDVDGGPCQPPSILGGPGRLRHILARVYGQI
jgi:hypothetical protein